MNCKSCKGKNNVKINLNDMVTAFGDNNSENAGIVSRIEKEGQRTYIWVENQLGIKRYDAKSCASEM